MAPATPLSREHAAEGSTAQEPSALAAYEAPPKPAVKVPVGEVGKHPSSPARLKTDLGVQHSHVLSSKQVFKD